MLAFAAIGPEFRVSAPGIPPDRAGPAVAADADGDVVMAWSKPAGADGYDLYACRYNTAGAPQGAEFRVNTRTAGNQVRPSVAVDADGDFVVAWASSGQDSSGYGVYAQRYNAAGVAQGAEFRVNSTVANNQDAPSVAADADGNFMVAWTSTGQDGSSDGVYAQRYNAAGVNLGTEFLVNTFTDFGQADPSVAADANGDFVVAWTSYEQDLDLGGVYAQRYDAAGVRQGGAFRVNSTILSNQWKPSVAADARGDFVVAWQTDQNGGLDVYAQRYSAGGIAQGGEFRVMAGHANPSVASDADGDFIVAAQSVNTPGVLDVDAQPYSAIGTPRGGVLRVNVATTLARGPVISADADGDAIGAWEGAHPTEGEGIYAQRYDETTDASGPIVSGVLVAGRQLLPNEQVPAPPPTTQIVVDASEALSITGGAAGLHSAINVANWGLTRNGSDLSSSIQSVSFGRNTGANKYQAVLNVSSTVLVGGNYILTAKAALRDPAGNALDGNRDGHPGGDYSFPFTLLNDPPTTIGIEAVQVAKDESPTVINLWDVFSDPNDPVTGLSFAVTGNTNPGLFSSTTTDSSTGTLTLMYAPNTTGTAQLTVRATDNGGLFVSTTFTVTVSSVNQPPVNTVPGLQIAAPGKTLVFSPANRNAISVSDPDAGAAPVLVTLETGRGYALQLAQTTGLTIVSAAPLQFSGSIADVNAALNGLRLVPPAGAGEGSTFVRITTDDQGNSGVGGSLTDVDSVPVAFASSSVVLSVADVAVVEGQNGTTQAIFTIRATGTQVGAISVAYATADGTAIAGSDYVARQGELVFDGERQNTIAVSINGDTAVEANEQFFLNLTSAKGALIGDGQAVGTITNDDFPPTPEFSINDVTVTEGDSGATGAVFTITLAAPSSNTLSVDYATSSGTAAAPADYAAASGTLVFQPGQTSKTVAVQVNGDTTDERDENFFVILSNPQGGPVPIIDGSASATILDDDDPPVVSVSDASLAEGNAGTTQMVFTLTLSAASEKSLAVSISSTNGTAQAGVDFGGPGGSIVFVPGETSKTINVGVFGDTTPEPDETFFFNLSDPFEVTIGDGTGVGTIVNDDGAVAGPKVTQVYVSGSAWSSAYKQFLQTSGKGDATFGYAVPAGTAGAQLAVLPWGNLDQLSVRFDKDVLVLGTDLDLRGMTVASGHYGVSGFAYDDATHTATWTLAQPLRGDKLLLDLDGDADGVADADTGALLDGDWASGSSAYPSGDGSAGGDLRYRLNVLTGDVNGNGSVSLLDWVQERLRTSRSIANPGAGTFAYGPLYDLNGDGRIDDADMRLIRRNLLRSLPAAAPATLSAVAPPAPPPALAAALAARRAATRDWTATAELFSASPILG